MGSKVYYYCTQLWGVLLVRGDGERGLGEGIIVPHICLCTNCMHFSCVFILIHKPSCHCLCTLYEVKIRLGANKLSLTFPFSLTLAHRLNQTEE